MQLSRGFRRASCPYAVGRIIRLGVSKGIRLSDSVQKEIWYLWQKIFQIFEPET